MKKKLFVVLTLFCFCLAGIYCQDKIVKKDGMYYRGDNIEKFKLSKNQIMSVTKIVKKPVYLTVNDWSKVKITSDFLDELKAHTEFTNQEKFMLLSYIFDNLPINTDDGIVREIYIGGYFQSNLPLEIRIGLLTPTGDAINKNQKAVVLFSNAVKMKNGEINKVTGFFGSLDSNACTISGLNGDKLTNVQNIKEDDSLAEENIEKMDTINQIMLVQGYLADDDFENDLVSSNILKKIIAKKDVQPALHIMAMLKQYEFLLSVNNIAEAEILWNEIKEYSKNVPGDMNPDSLESMNGESLFMMKELQKKADI